MADQEPGLLTSSMAAMVTPRKTSSATRRSRASGLAEPCIRLQVAQGRLLVALLLAQPGEVVMRVRVVVVEGDGAAVGLRRVAHTAQILQRDAEVEPGRVVVGLRGDGLAVVLLRRGRRALLVEEAAQVDVRVGMAGVELQRALVRFLRLFDGAELELAGEVEPVVRAELLLALAGLLHGAQREGRRPH